jgi:hypothetical protein
VSDLIELFGFIAGAVTGVLLARLLGLLGLAAA